MNHGTPRQFTPLERTYAEALLRAARRQEALAQVRRDAQVLLSVVQKSPRLLLFLESPHVKMEDKLGLLDRVFKNRLSPLLINLLHLLAARRRTTWLDEILELFLELAEEAEGVFYATVTSAVQLAEDQRQALQAALECYTRTQLQIAFEVDPELLGGIIFRARDLLVDGSVASGLAALKRRLLETSLSGARPA